MLPRRLIPPRADRRGGRHHFGAARFFRHALVFRDGVKKRADGLGIGNRGAMLDDPGSERSFSMRRSDRSQRGLWRWRNGNPDAVGIIWTTTAVDLVPGEDSILFFIHLKIFIKMHVTFCPNPGDTPTDPPGLRDYPGSSPKRGTAREFFCSR